MKRLSLITSFVLLFAFATGAVSGQSESGYDLYQRALVKERAVGDVEEALRLYQRIVHEFGSNHALAAKAQYRMGLLYDRLGRRAEAQRNYQGVVSNYSDQSEIARQARARIEVAPNPNGGAKAKANSVSDKWARNMATRQVWAYTGVDYEGMPSFDGRYLSFVDWQTGDLAIRDLSTGQNRRLTNKGSWQESEEFALDSALSPDGNQIVYAWFNKHHSFDLRLARVDRGESKVLNHNDEVDYIQPTQWSMDGKQILALISRKDGTNQIALISASEGTVRVLKTLDWRIPSRMSLSPDGHFVIYDFPPDAKSPNRDIFLLVTDGSREVPLVQGPANDKSPIWTSDGKSVVFVSNRGGSEGLWLIGVKDGRPDGSPQLIKPTVGNILLLGMTEKGSLYYATTLARNDVYTASLDPSNNHLSTTPQLVSQRFVGFNSVPTWSPDGESIAYVARAGDFGGFDDASIVIRSFKTGEEQQLSPRMYFGFELAWSPDGRTLLTSAQDAKGRWGIYQLDVETGKTSLIVQAGSTCALGCAPKGWFPDGKSIFYRRRASSGNERQAIVRRNIETGEEQELYIYERAGFDLGFVTLSPDGRQLAAWMGGDSKKKEIILIPSDKSKPRVLLPVDDAVSEQTLAGTPPGLAWTPDGKYVIFGKRVNRDKSTELWRVNVETGKPEKIGTVTSPVHDIVVHPKGSRIAYSTSEAKREVWVMENFLPAAQKGKASVAKR